MTNDNRIIIINRLKSFAWRAGMMLAALAIDFVLQNLGLFDGLFDFPPQATIVVGLILGEVSKYLNTQAK